MALLYDAELHPSKLQLIERWAPSQPWFEAGAAPLEKVAHYRFDDPAGEVGIETMLVKAGDGPLLQVPMTYRAAPLEGADAWLIGTMEHSVLGTRYTYDAAGDPVYLSAASTIALRAGRQADMWIEIDGVMTKREPDALVTGSGEPGALVPAMPSLASISITHQEGATIAETDTVQFVIIRTPHPHPHSARDRQQDPGSAVLRGTWTDQPVTTTLALVRML